MAIKMIMPSTTVMTTHPTPTPPELVLIASASTGGGDGGNGGGEGFGGGGRFCERMVSHERHALLMHAPQLVTDSTATFSIWLSFCTPAVANNVAAFRAMISSNTVTFAVTMTLAAVTVR